MPRTQDGATSSQNSTAKYDLSSSFDAALAQVDVDTIIPDEKPPPMAHGRRRVAFVEKVNQAGHESRDDECRKEEMLAQEGSIVDPSAVAMESHNEGLPRLQDDYLENDAYSAIKFGDISNYMRHRRVKL